jgi:hypothetical protein
MAATAQTQETPTLERRKQSRDKPPKKDYGWPLFLIVVTVLMIAGYLPARDNLYKAGDNIGYNLGLAGGIMMVTLLIYPLRKRWRVLRNWWLLPGWFKWHMVFGVVGPAIVVWHTTYTLRSTNATVAFVCMMLVSGSGIFGRFFYRKIHYGLYGRHSSMEQMQGSLLGSESNKSVINFAPEVQKILTEFRDTALDPEKVGQVNPWRFIKLSVQAKLVSMKVTAALEDAMYSDAHVKKWNAAQMKRLDEMFYQNRDFIKSYIGSIEDIAHFKTYEYLFSLWHIFHVPLVFMLVFSGIWHVIAVHKY